MLTAKERRVRSSNYLRNLSKQKADEYEKQHPEFLLTLEKALAENETNMFLTIPMSEIYDKFDGLPDFLHYYGYETHIKKNGEFEIFW